MPRRDVWVVASVTTAMAVMSCDSQPDGQMSEPSPTPTPAEETSAEDLALEAYEDMWAVVVEASHTGETDPDELDRYAEDQAHALMVQALQNAVEEDTTYDGDPGLEPEIVSIDSEDPPEDAEIEDCADGSAWLPEDSESSDTEPRHIEATASYDGLAWRVSEMRIWEPGSCE